MAQPATTGEQPVDGSLVAHLRAKVSQIVSGIKAGAAQAQSVVDDAATSAKCYIAAARGKLASAYEDLKAKGTKEWLVGLAHEVAVAARGAATSAAALAADAYTSTKAKLAERARQLSDNGAAATVCIRERTAAAAASVKAKSLEAAQAARNVAADGKFQATAAAATGGAVAGGAGGAATGLAAGGAIGAAVGLVPALFTFGLSIPIGAFVGGGSGLLLGAVAGGTCGAVGAGAAGYGVYSRKDEIGQCAGYVQEQAAEVKTRLQQGSAAAVGHVTDRVHNAAGFTKAKARASADYVAERASAARARLMGRSGTGGTESAD